MKDPSVANFILGMEIEIMLIGNFGSIKENMLR
jgi:hypothetical protein